MYRKLLMAVLVLGLVVSTASADITTGLIAHYTFDDTLAGSAGGEVSGVKVGTGAATYQVGPGASWAGKSASNKAIRLDGVDDAISLPHAVTSYTDGTVALWAWFYHEPSHNTAMYNADYTGAWNGGELNLWLSNLGNQDGQNYPGACGTVVNGNAPWNLDLKWNVGTMPNDGHGAWAHVAITHDAGTLSRIYVNGTPIMSAVPSSAQGFTLAPAFVGASGWLGALGGVWDSKYDDVRVYDRALSRGDIMELPEPATIALLGLGSLALLRRKKK